MDFPKFLRTLSFALLIGINTPQLSANAGISTPFFTSFSQQSYLEIDDKDSSFSFRIVDKNLDSKAGLVRLLEEKRDMTFLRHDFSLKDSLKEVQLFDIADKFLKQFSNAKKLTPEQIEQDKNYLALVKQRFLIPEKDDLKIKYDFEKFFESGFKSQDNIEDLVMYGYLKYSKLIREVKMINPGQTFQSLIDNSSLWDQLRFLLLAFSYANNVDRLGYKFMRNPVIDEDYFELDLLNKNAKNSPYLKIEMNMNSMPDSVNIDEIRDFLNGKDQVFFKYDSKGNYLYGGFKCDK